MDYSNYYSYSYGEDGCMLWERRPAGHGLWERTPPAVGGRNLIIFRLFSIIFDYFSAAPPPNLVGGGARTNFFDLSLPKALTGI